MARERSKNQQSESPAMERHRGGQVSRRERDWPSYGSLHHDAAVCG